MKVFPKSVCILSLILIFLGFACKKETLSSDNCNIQGTFTGTSTSSTGITVQMTYRFQENNLAVGLAPVTNTPVTFGGYKNTCDSVYLSVYYSLNNSYYLLKGKLTNGRTTISGVYNNLNTVAEFGTFSISK